VWDTRKRCVLNVSVYGLGLAWGVKYPFIMSVLCGMDFSESSSRAAEVAAALAERMKEPLQLVHSLADWPGEVYSAEKDSLLAATRRALDAQAQRLKRPGLDVELQVELDAPGKSLLRAAQEKEGSLLVFGATGRGKSERPVGGTADRLAQKSNLPALVVRDSEPFLAWLRGEKPLKVLVGVDSSLVSGEAWRWASGLARWGKVELVAAYVYWPPQEFHRLGLSGMRSYIDADPEVDKVLRREMEGRFPGARLLLQPGLGRPSDHLLTLASEEKADLVVVGSHQRGAVARLWEGSVSRGVLHDAPMSVACIPVSAVKRTQPVPVIRSVLVATDFSEAGNAAVAHGFAQAAHGGKVTLVHVLEKAGARSEVEAADIFKISPASEPAQKDALRQLEEQVPVSGQAQAPAADLLVLEAKEVAAAIAQAADRLGADLVCVGTQGKKLGPVAQGLLAQTQRPVLLVRAPRE